MLSRARRQRRSPATSSSAIVKRINQARRLRAQLDKRSDAPDRRAVRRGGAHRGATCKNRDKLELLEAKVMAEVSRRHGELGQAAAEYKQDTEHGTWELRYGAGMHGVRRHTTINADLVRSAEFVELRKISAELARQLDRAARRSCTTSDEPREIEGLGRDRRR